MYTCVIMRVCVYIYIYVYMFPCSRISRGILKSSAGVPQLHQKKASAPSGVPRQKTAALSQCYSVYIHGHQDTVDWGSWASSNVSTRDHRIRPMDLVKQKGPVETIKEIVAKCACDILARNAGVPRYLLVI